MIPESANRNFGYGIRGPGNRVRFPGCCTLQSIVTILKRNVMGLSFSSNLIRIFASYNVVHVNCTQFAWQKASWIGIRPGELFLA